jgi:hypothetical protein
MLEKAKKGRQADPFIELVSEFALPALRIVVFVHCLAPLAFRLRFYTRSL